MAKLKAYPKGTTESIEWTLNPEVDIDEVAQIVTDPATKTITARTTTGWVILTTNDYAAFEIITD